MYALMNTMFSFPIGRIKRNGKVGKKPKYYKTGFELEKAYHKLSGLQRLVIVPAEIEANHEYSQIEFKYPDVIAPY